MKIQKGTTFPDFTITTHMGESRQFAEITAQHKKTVLLFLRYYGCTICQLDLQAYAKRYAEFTAKEAEVIIVLQSTPEIVRKGGMKIPYTVACDPDMTLYRQFEVSPAKGKLGLVSLKAIQKVRAAKKAGCVHGKSEGEELQLPATFVVDRSGVVIYSHYAKNVADIPSIDHLLGIV